MASSPASTRARCSAVMSESASWAVSPSTLTPVPSASTDTWTVTPFFFSICSTSPVTRQLRSSSPVKLPVPSTLRVWVPKSAELASPDTVKSRPFARRYASAPSRAGISITASGAWVLPSNSLSSGSRVSMSCVSVYGETLRVPVS